MIDWISAKIPVKHKPIPRDLLLVISPDLSHEIRGNRYLSVKRSEFEEHSDDEGSFSSNLTFSSEYEVEYSDGEVRYAPANYMPKSVYEMKGWAVGLARDADYLVINGNPAKFLQGHNVFGSDSITTLLMQVIVKIWKKIGFSIDNLRDCLKIIFEGNYFITRLDITHMYDLGSDASVDKYIRALQFCADTRGNRCELSHNTFYVGKHSTLWSIKFYNKFKELNSVSTKHRLPPSLLNSGILEFAEGKLRVELTLRKKAIDKLGKCALPRNLEQIANQIYLEHLKKINIKGNHMDTIDVTTLPHQYQRTYLMWRAGHNLHSILSKPTFYRHKKYFESLGINIKLAPVDLQKQEAEIKPLPMIIPKMCKTPSHLLQYQVREVESIEQLLSA